MSPRPGGVTFKLPTGAAVELDATIDEITDALHDQLPADEREAVTRGELEAKAAELLTHPHAAAAFLDQIHDPAPEPAPDPAPSDDIEDTGDGGTPGPRAPRRRPAVIYVHLSDLVLGGRAPGVARVEGVGPMLLEQVAELLAHRQVTVQPVIDLNHVHAVNGYEHPTLVKHRTLLRMLGDVFPHSANRGYRRLDHDHAIPYRPLDRGGGPGQTGDANDAPLTRTHHRIKTHDPGWDLRQLGLGAYRWTTPHGHARIVTPSGTRRIEILRNHHGHVTGEIYPPDRPGPPVG